MSNTIRLLLIFITTQILFGCSATRYISFIFHEEVVFFYSSTSYPGELTDFSSRDFHQSTLVFGPYMPNIGGIGAFGGNYHLYKGPMKGEEILAFWQVKTDKNMLRYYVRSESGRGIIRADRNGHNAYHVGIALGPMRVLKTGLTDEQLNSADIVDYTLSGKPLYYRWGDWDKLYYVTGIFTARELKTIPRKFHEIQGIAITAEQYDKLYERCHGEWKAVKCFMDESFPNLTPEQLIYIQSRTHPDDDDRLAGKFPKPVDPVNKWL
jgi:hypothetical protein